MSPILILREICSERRPQTTLLEIIEYVTELGLPWVPERITEGILPGHPGIPRARRVRDPVSPQELAAAKEHMRKRARVRSSKATKTVASNWIDDAQMYRASVVSAKLGMATSGNLTRLIAQGKLEGRKTSQGWWWVSGKSLRVWLATRKKRTP